MAVAVEQRVEPAAKFGSQVDEQIAQATGRIRVHDLALGVLTLASLAAVYATAMILCDKYLNLPEWVRQLSLGGFGLAMLGITYFLVVHPLRRRINPLYAAARVERTIDDPKNSVTGFVEAREKGEVHNAVKAAMSAKAAKAVSEADVNHAVDHRSLIVAGGILLVFLLTLAVLFFVFRPAQFSSLIQRAVFPFSSDPIAKRTELNLLKPEPPEPTITTGQTITVVVHVSGKVPSKTAPDRVRLLLRHNPADPNYEEIAMEEGESSRDWQIKVPDYLVQNGFFYKVAGGDNETPEYRVTVRTLPQYSDYEVSYVHPAYTRKPDEKATGPNIRGYRGTKVTLIGKTNRELKEGLMRFEAAHLEPVIGKPVTARPDCLEFKFTASDPTRYKLFLTSTSGERNTDPAWLTLSIDSDAAPIVQITKPEEAETTLVANGQLKVDGTLGDDFGIDKVRLRMRIDGRELAPVPYMAGKSLLREKDKTWPTNLEFKLSADFANLKYADGAQFVAQFGSEKPPVIDFWVEAIDNCSEAKPVPEWNNQIGNVGRSVVQRVRLTPPEMVPEKKQELDDQKQQRGDEEKQHNQEQQKKLDNEDRKPPEQKKADEPQKKEGEPGAKKNDEPGTKKDGEKGSKKEDDPNPKKKGMDDGTGTSGMDPMGMPPPKNGKEDPKTPPEKKAGSGTGADMGMGAKSDPSMPPPKEEKKGMSDAKGMNDSKGMNDTRGMNDTGMPMGGTSGDMGMNNANPMPTAPKPRTQEEKELDKKTKDLQKELDRNKGQGGDAKPNPTANADENRKEPAQPKPQPPQDGMGMDPQSKPKPADPKMPPPMGGDQNSASESKPEGKLNERPNPDSTGKPGPQQSSSKEPSKKPTDPSETRSEPLGGSPGEDKPQPKKEGNSDPKVPMDANKDPMSGSGGKPPTAKPEPKDGTPSGPPSEKPQPPADAARQKPNMDPTRGEDRAQTEPKPTPGTDERPRPDPMAGDAKPQRAPESATAKPMPKDDAMGMKPQDASGAKPPPEPKNPADPKADGASEARPDGKKSPMGLGKVEKEIDKGMDKPGEQERSTEGAKNNEVKNKLETNEGKKGDASSKELEDAVKDLTDPDPKKQQAARDKLDKRMGKDAREIIEQGQKEKKAELEQLQKDAMSPDKATAEAAQKKLDELRQKAEVQAKKDGMGRELTDGEKKELMEKARDLTSKDEAKRQAAEKSFDDKLGKEAREKIQDEIKKREDELGKEFGPKQKEDLQKKIDDIAKNTPPEGKGPLDSHNNKSGASSEPPKPAMEDDPRNRAKTAQLQLEEFEKNRYNRDLHDRLGWKPGEYEGFLNAVRDRVEQLSKEAEVYDEAQRHAPKELPGDPKFRTAGGDKVDGLGTQSKIDGSRSGPVVAPPGFGDARDKFNQPRPKKQ